MVWVRSQNRVQHQKFGKWPKPDPAPSAEEEVAKRSKLRSEQSGQVGAKTAMSLGEIDRTI